MSTYVGVNGVSRTYTPTPTATPYKNPDMEWVRFPLEFMIINNVSNLRCNTTQQIQIINTPGLTYGAFSTNAIDQGQFFLRRIEYSHYNIKLDFDNQGTVVTTLRTPDSWIFQRTGTYRIVPVTVEGCLIETLGEDHEYHHSVSWFSDAKPFSRQQTNVTSMNIPPGIQQLSIDLPYERDEFQSTIQKVGGWYPGSTLGYTNFIIPFILRLDTLTATDLYMELKYYNGSNTFLKNVTFSHYLYLEGWMIR